MSPLVDKMFSVREFPWWTGTGHDKGQAEILGDYPSWDAARVFAGLAWDPGEEELRLPADLDLLEGEMAEILYDAALDEHQRLAALVAAADAAHAPVEGWKHVFRNDSGRTLACTMETYKVISNSDFGAIFEAIMQTRAVRFVTGGCLDGGRQVWMLAVLDEPIEVRGDNTLTLTFLAITSRHDARGKTVLRATNVRIVCANTFSSAELQGERIGHTYSFTHRGNWRAHIDDARRAIEGVRDEGQAYAKLAADLMDIHVTRKGENMFIERFFPMPPYGVASDKVIANVEGSRQALRLLLDGPTVAGAGVGGTAYGLLQGAGEYLDHVRRSRSWETRLGRTLLKPEPLKARALGIVRELVSA